MERQCHQPQVRPSCGAYQACHEPERRQHSQVWVAGDRQLLKAVELSDGGGHLAQAVGGEVEANELAGIAKALWQLF